MRIALIEPPKFVDIKNHVSMVTTPPLGLVYIAGSLRYAGHKVVVINSIGEAIGQLVPFRDRVYVRGLTTQEIIQRIPSDIDAIGFSCRFSYLWLLLKPLIKDVRERFPHIPLIQGGEHPTGLPYECMKETSFDFLVLGEGEEIVVDQLEAIDGKRSFTDVAGIVYRKNGEIIKNERGNRIRAIDDISLPAWDFFLSMSTAALTNPMVPHKGVSCLC